MCFINQETKGIRLSETINSLVTLWSSFSPHAAPHRTPHKDPHWWNPTLTFPKSQLVEQLMVIGYRHPILNSGSVIGPKPVYIYPPLIMFLWPDPFPWVTHPCMNSGHLGPPEFLSCKCFHALWARTAWWSYPSGIRIWIFSLTRLNYLDATFTHNNSPYITSNYKHRSSTISTEIKAVSSNIL